MTHFSPDMLAASAAGLAVFLALILVVLAIQQSARAAALERRLHDDQESLRGLINDLDRALRQEIATGTRAGLEAAFDRVQAGLRAQAESLESFGRVQRETIGRSLAEFGEQQKERLAQADKTAQDGSAAIKEVLGAFRLQMAALDVSLQVRGSITMTPVSPSTTVITAKSNPRSW